MKYSDIFIYCVYQNKSSKNTSKINKVHYYSTSTKGKVPLPTPPYIFKMREIQKTKNLYGVSGVYMIINNNNPSLFYIGSSINLQRRLVTYYDAIQGSRKGSSSFEKSLNKTSINHWSIQILAFVPKHLVLIEEQLAICTFYPSLNVNYKVLINYWHPGFNVKEALELAINYQGLFPINSVNYARFDRLINSLKGLNSLKNSKAYILNGNVGKPVFVYDYVTKNLVRIYGSNNSAIKRLNVSIDTITKSATKQIIFTSLLNQELVISFIALTKNEINAYVKDRIKIQLEFNIYLKDNDGKIVENYKSLRAFCKTYTEFSLRTLRRKLGDGMTVFNGLTIEVVKVSRSKTIYCYDPDTKLRISTFSSVTAAQKSLKLNFYTLKSLVESNNFHEGLLYSYSLEYPLPN